jgi:flagellar hook-associated protein 2
MSTVSSALSTILDPVTVSGSSSSSGSSSTSSGTSSTSSTSSTFTGTSNYSSDLQNVISRAVAIAELPVTQLTNEQTALQSQYTELSTIGTDLTSLETAVSGVDAAVSGSYGATVSNPDLVSASVGSGAVAGSYSIEVDSAGAYATSLSANTWAGTSSDAGGTYSLVIGATSYNIASTDGSATSVAAAINQQYGDQVQATVVNVRSNASPDQRISLQATSLGAQTFDIQDASGDSLQTQGPAGSEASYIVDASGNTVSSDSPTLTIATGVTINLLAADPGNPVTITVSGNDEALSSALTTFTTAYNKVATDLESQRGTSAGPLQGQPILSEIARSVATLATYSGTSTGGLGTLAELGLTLGENGQLTFKSETLDTAYANSPSAVASFLGSATGGGWLLSATGSLTNLLSPTTGLLTNQETNLQTQSTALTAQITAKNAQIATMQSNLTQQMAAADTLIATIEQQGNYLTEMMQAQQDDQQQITNG